MINRYQNKLASIYRKIRPFILPSNEPSFIIIGAQKSGTTSLHYYLEQHPKLMEGRTKEIGYFHRDIYFGKTYTEYKRDFSGPPSKIYFESTPEYLIHPNVAENIHEMLPEIRLIVLLREPVKRAYSAWNHYRQHFETGKYIKAIKNKPRREGNLLFEALFSDRSSFPSFRECLEIELNLMERGIGFEPALLRRGLYLEQLQEYWQYFKPEQMLILGFRDFVKDTDSVLNRVSKFLDIECIDWSKINREPRNSRDYAIPMNDDDKLLLENFYRKPNMELFERIGTLDW